MESEDAHELRLFNVRKRILVEMEIQAACAESISMSPLNYEVLTDEINKSKEISAKLNQQITELTQQSGRPLSDGEKYIIDYLRTLNIDLDTLIKIQVVSDMILAKIPTNEGGIITNMSFGDLGSIANIRIKLEQLHSNFLAKYSAEILTERKNGKSFFNKLMSEKFIWFITEVFRDPPRAFEKYTQDTYAKDCFQRGKINYFGLPRALIFMISEIQGKT
jgi:hypothetical protein